MAFSSPSFVCRIWQIALLFPLSAGKSFYTDNNCASWPAGAVLLRYTVILGDSISSSQFPSLCTSSSSFGALSHYLQTQTHSHSDSDLDGLFGTEGAGEVTGAVQIAKLPLGFCLISDG